MTGYLARRVAALAGVLVALVAAVSVLDRTSWQVDLTAEHALTLSSQTKDVLRGVRRPVHIYAFLSRQEGGRAEAASLLSRYRRLNPRISFTVTDPSEAPGQVRRLGVDPVFGGVAAQQGRRIERGPTASEQDFTSMLARLQRNVEATVCFSGGHGERSVAATTDDGLSKLAAQLVANGYRIRTVDLLATDVIGDCDALIMADPNVALGERGRVVGDWLEEGGRALVLADPQSSVDLNPLLTPFGLQLRHGLVLEGSDGDRLPGDPLTPIISHFHSAFPFVHRLPPLVLPTVQAVSADESRAGEGVIASGFASTTRLAYLETQADRLAFDPDTDVAGPIDVAAAAQVARHRDGRTIRTRVAVIGDVDLATNAVIDEAGNSKLLTQITDWLTLDEDLVTVSTNVATIRPLALTEARLRYARLLLAAGVPLAFLLAGAMVWAVRRGR
jgi:ABC-type uncharacterized transport system involved in gliding motility auxiliary subunit